MDRKIARFRDCRGCWIPRGARLGNLVADDQLRSTRLVATEREVCSGGRPTPTGDGTTMGGETDGGGRGRGWRRVKSVVDACALQDESCPGNYLLFCFLKTQFSLSIKGSNSYTW